MSELDKAYEAAVALVQDVEPRLQQIITEEDSKIQLILRFFTEVLGWSHSDIGAERKHDNGFSDFIIQHLGAPALLIEAKRQTELGIATSATTRQAYKIVGPALKPSLDAIEQAASYASPEGMQMAIVSDGVRWIFFKPHISGENYKKKEAIVFPSLSAVISGFAEFYELASKEGFKSSLYKRIFDRIHQNRVLLSKPLSTPFGDGDIHPRHKSKIAFDLDHVFNRYFSNLTGENDPKLLIECFVETKESRIADFALEKLTAHVLGNIDPSNTNVDDSLQRLIVETISDEEGETVFIVGPPGAGKTTFLTRFFEKTLPRPLKEKCVVVNINMLDASGDSNSISRWVTDAIISTLEVRLYDKGFPVYDDLLGLYHLEYKRRAQGIDADLYNNDKDGFRKKFNDWLEGQVENDREGYLRKLLQNVVVSRKRLPVFVIDNTDEFSMEFKQSLFQYFQALKRHVTHCLLIFPVTDRSAWSFSKTEIFNIYSSRSYFLPTPSPREVFRKRVDYLKANSKPLGKTRGSYELSNLKVSVENLQAFASVIEEFFVEQDYVSNRIGSLANYNIRKTLALARRIITSAELDIEDLVKTYLLGGRSQLTPEKFMRALLLGDFNFFKKTDGHYIVPIFDVDQEVRQSPLLTLRILALLHSIHDKRQADEARYLDISSIVQYFDVMGYSEASVETAVSQLLTTGLIEAYDPSAGNAVLAQRVAVTYSGIAHMQLALFNSVYFSQMALTALMADAEVAFELRAAFDVDRSTRGLRQVRERFAAYLMDEDANFCKCPDSPQYDIQRAVTGDIKKYADGTSDEALSERDVIEKSSRTGLIAEQVDAVVDWFDAEKGYGFATIQEPRESAFLHASVLEKSGIDEVSDGDELVCDLSRSAKGVAISKVHSARTDSSGLAYDAYVTRTFDDRGYGFVYVPTLNQDAFFHYSLVAHPRGNLAPGRKLRAEINADPRGRGLQVRRIIAIQGTASSHEVQ